MSYQGIIKTGVILGNALLLTGGYLVYKMLYANYLKFKKESKRLADGGQSDYQYLIDAFNKEGKEGQIQVENNQIQLQFKSMTSLSLELLSKILIYPKNDFPNNLCAFKSQQNIEIYLCQRNTTRTQWVKAFNLKDQNNHHVIVHVYQKSFNDQTINNKDSFMPSIFQKVLPPSKEEGSIENVKEAFSVNVSENGIAFGSSLYVFGNFIKNKLGQIQCVESKVICKAADARNSTQNYSYAYFVGAACVATLCLLISGISIYYTFQQPEEKQNKVRSNRR